MQTEATAERDARLVNAGHGEINPNDIAVGVVIGRTSEFFDFFVYAIASVIVFPRLVFPFVDPLTGTLYSFAIFAFAFAARPLGTLIFTKVDRRYGKSTKLTLALFMLGTATVLIGFLPGYERIGIWAAVILTVLRTLQGIAVAGTWDGLASLLALNAPEHKRGWYAMIPQLGAPLGLLVASILFAFFVGNLSATDFYDWGWRYPFFVAFAINVVALFARLRIVVTPEYTNLFDNQELRPAPIRETLRAEGRNVVIGAFAPLASFALFHMVTVFPLSWIFLYTREHPARFLFVEAAGAVICTIAVFVSGALSDRYGRRKVLMGCALAIAIFSGFAPQLLDGGLAGETLFMFSGFALLGLAFGQSSGAVAASFSKPYRYTGSALTSDLAWLFGAGFAPLAALLLASQFGLIAAGAYLLSGALCTLLALRLNARWDIRDR
ncbi:MAG: MFS transporter [Methylobacterium mesophilicum]|nr:MFS transporter [Methylobacterium mesophilicum]